MTFFFNKTAVFMLISNMKAPCEWHIIVFLDFLYKDPYDEDKNLSGFVRHDLNQPARPTLEWWDLNNSSRFHINKYWVGKPQLSQFRRKRFSRDHTFPTFKCHHHLSQHVQFVTSDRKLTKSIQKPVGRILTYFLFSELPICSTQLPICQQDLLSRPQGITFRGHWHSYKPRSYEKYSLLHLCKSKASGYRVKAQYRLNTDTTNKQNDFRFGLITSKLEVS